MYSETDSVILDTVSVAIPIYNCVDYVDACFESLLNQKLDISVYRTELLEDRKGEDELKEEEESKPRLSLAVEVSVYEDGSTDGTAEKVEEWVEKIKNVGGAMSVKFSKNETGKPLGVGHGRNKAITQSKGSYICFCDADDIFDPDRIRKQYLIARKNQNAVVGCKFRRLPEGSSETFTSWANCMTPDQLKLQVYLTFGPTVVMPGWFCHKKVYDRIPGGFDESGKGTPEDLIFFYKHLDTGGDVLRVEETLLTYRYHAQSTTFSVANETIWNIRLARLESEVLAHWKSFTIWNAGKSGRRFYRGLQQRMKDKVVAFCDIDEKKLKQKSYHPYPLKCKIPIVHPKSASAPFIICVKAEFIFELHGDFRVLLDSLGIREGVDYFYFN